MKPLDSDTAAQVRRRGWTSLGLDLVTLRMFLSTAEAGTVGRAAERENIALSAVSRRIADLEARTGLILFDRRDRGMTLTAAGRALVQQVRLVFDQLDELTQELDALRSGEKGYLRLFHQAAAAEHLPEIVATFLKANPNIKIEIDEASAREIVRSIRSGEADVGIVTSRTAADASDLHQRVWMDDELVAILPNGHPLLSRHKLGSSDICEYPLVTLQRADAILAIFRDAAHKRGVPLQERVHVASYESARRMVAAGLGIAVVPASAADRPDTGHHIQIRRLEDPWARRSLVVCARAPEHQSAATARLISHFEQSLRVAG